MVYIIITGIISTIVISFLFYEVFSTLKLILSNRVTSAEILSTLNKSVEKVVKTITTHNKQIYQLSDLNKELTAKYHMLIIHNYKDKLALYKTLEVYYTHTENYEMSKLAVEDQEKIKEVMKTMYNMNVDVEIVNENRKKR